MRLIGRGDERIRATHTKTLELSADTDITERATCVIGVDTRVDGVRMAGPVRVTISAGGESCALDAHANSSWVPGGPAVIRRGALRLPGTLAIRADAAAADLPRPLVDALRDPNAVVEVLVERRPTQPCLVLFAADPLVADDPRLAAELAAADVVVAEDDTARSLVDRAEPAPASIEGRVLVVATSELPGASVPRADVPVETVGLAPPLAAAATAPWAGAVVFGSGRDAADLVRRTPAWQRLVLDTDRRRLPDLLALAADIRGSRAAVVVQECADPVVFWIGDSIDFPGADQLYCCLGPGAPDEQADTADPRVVAAVTALLADGVATKVVARAVHELTGWSQRRAYDAVLALRTGRPGQGVER